MLIVATTVVITWRILLRNRKMSVRQFGVVYLLTAVGLGLVYLGITGRLHWLFALLGGLMPFFAAALRNGLQILRTYALFRNASGLFSRFTGAGFGQQPVTPGRTSQIKTAFLDMSLDHDSGNLDGSVLAGQFAGQSLSQLDFQQTMDLLQECQPDNDSVNVLRAYLERTYPDWEHEDASDPNSSVLPNDDMNETQAFAILGLETDATKEEIVAAHRRLIQKMHPDRGGSTFLAARINEAKSLLIKSKSSK